MKCLENDRIINSSMQLIYIDNKKCIYYQYIMLVFLKIIN